MWLIADSIVVLIAGVQLFALPNYTHLFFAWTITPALSAAFLGAGYWASLPLLYLSSRQTTWPRARLAVFGVLIFSVLTLAATLRHLDRFHLSNASPLALVSAWVWLIIYLVFPPLLLSLLVAQVRLPGHEPVPEVSPPMWFRLVIAGQAAVLLTFGSILLIAPTTPLWPWGLSPLVGRAIAAWLVGIGVIAAQAAWENDWQRVGAGLLSYTTFGGLQMLALGLHSGSVELRAPQGAGYLLFLASIVVVGGYGWRAARQTTRASAGTNDSSMI